MSKGLRKVMQGARWICGEGHSRQVDSNCQSPDVGSCLLSAESQEVPQGWSRREGRRHEDAGGVNDMCVGAEEATGGFWSRRLTSAVLPVKRIILAAMGKTDYVEKVVMTDIARLVYREGCKNPSKRRHQLSLG